MLERMWSKGEQSSIAGGSANLYSHFENQYDGFSESIENQSTSSPAIPLLGIYIKYAHSHHKSINSIIYIAALFIIAGI